MITWQRATHRQVFIGQKGFAWTDVLKHFFAANLGAQKSSLESQRQGPQAGNEAPAIHCGVELYHFAPVAVRLSYCAFAGTLDLASLEQFC